MGFLSCGLMGSAPKRPCDDVGGSYALSRETVGYSADFLDRPPNEVGCLSGAFALFLGAELLA